GEATQRLIARSATTTPLGPVLLKGRTDELEAFAVVDVAATPGSAADAPLVGRSRELEALEHAFARVVDDHACALFTVLGAAGVGKSRLVREFLAHVGDARVLSGRCLPYGDGITYWPVMGSVFEAAEISERDSQEDALGKIADLLGDHEDAKAISNLVGEAIGLGHRNAGQQEIFWAIRRLFETLAAERPLVLVFDDIHWAEATFLDLVDHLVEWATGAPLFVVCLARPELLESRPTWGGGKVNSTTILLDALSDEDARRFLGELLPGDTSDVARELQAVLDAAGGNPLFLEETIAMLVEDGTLEQADRQWRSTKQISELQIPPTIQALLAARLDQLPSEERMTIEAAGLIGKVFSVDYVAGLLDDDSDPSGTIESLTRKGLVRRDETDPGSRLFRFRHILIRDAAYQGIPKERRAALHERYARFLLESMGARVAEYEEVVGYHFEQAHRYLMELGAPADDVRHEAGRHLSAAGHRALVRGDAPAAVSLLRRVVPLVDQDRAGTLARLDLGSALRELGRYEEALDVFSDVATDAERVNDRCSVLLAKLELEDTMMHTEPGRSREFAVSVAKDAVKVFQQEGDDVGLARAYRALAYTHDMVGESRASLEALQKAIFHAQRSGDAGAVQMYQRVLMGSISWSPIHLADLVKETERFLADARANHDLRSQARALGILGMAVGLQGDVALGRRLIAEERVILDKMGLDVNRAWGVFEAVSVERAAHNQEGVERELREAVGILRAKREHLVLSTVLALLADACLERGNLDEARSLIGEAGRLGAEDDLLTQLKCLIVQGKLAEREGRVHEGIDLARAGVEMISPTEYLDWHADALVDLASLYERAGDIEAARDALARAADLYEQKGITVFLKGTQKRLELLAG
ncbi:MAG: AAA family ATPase, partial [Actinomycetota bacterium]|nr:AAA family ATPase [Actinomycetota bacterium]